MPLPTGTWKTSTNGVPGTLTIDAVDTQGSLSGSFSGDTMRGIWDEAGQKISFYYMTGSQAFVGYLAQDTFRMPGISGSTVFTLAGHFVDFSPPATGGRADRSVFGWYAQIGTP